MNKELEQKLFSEYPDLFADKDKPPTQSLMCFGCDCDDGWFHIIDAACKAISRHIKNRKNEDPYRFAQIKEKFGGLRIYGTGGDAYIQGVIDTAELMSFRTCEVCGHRAKSSGLKTLCEKHSGERGLNAKEWQD